MPDKTVTIRLRALTDDYQNKMAAAARSTTQVGDAGKGTQSKLVGMGKSAREVGGDLTKYVSLPLAAAGVAAVKLGTDFEDSFAKMQGLAGVTADEVAGLKEQVLELSHVTGQGPQELAEGLYFVRSAGLDGQAALDAITVSAKGAAAGMGSTAQVADALTSAINAYGVANLSAAQAGDVLVATAREGKAEASELAPQFGRLLPVATELGVRFDEVGAGLAFLSRNSGDASLSATQLDGVLQKLLKPSEQGRQALAGLGLTTDDLRRSIKDRGLLTTLQDLRGRLGDSGFNLFFDDIQGLQGALSLTGAQAGQAREVFDSLANTTGALDDAFGKASETTGFKMRQAWADVQVAAIQAGDVLLPLAGDLASALADLVGWFSKLPKPAQDGLLILAGYGAIIGPLINLVGRLVEGLGKVQQKLIDGFEAGDKMGKSLGRGGLAYNVGVATAALGAGVIALQSWSDMIRTSQRQGEDWADQWNKGFDVDTASFDDLGARIMKIDGLIHNIRDSKSDTWEFWDADSNAQLDAAADKLGTTRAELDNTRIRATDYSIALGISKDEALKLVLAHKELVPALDGTTGSFDTQAAAVQLVTDRIKEQSDAIKAQLDPLFAVTDAFDQNADSQRRVDDAQAKVNWMKAAGDAKGLAEAQRDLAAANMDAVRSAEGVQVALLNLAKGVADGSVNIDAARMMLQSWVTEGLITQAQADLASARFGEVGGKAAEVAMLTAALNADGLKMPVTAPGLDETLGKLNEIKSMGTSLSVAWQGLDEALAAALMRQAAGLPAIPTEGHAGGGRLRPGRWSVVGEHGRELVGPDMQVYTSGQTASMLTPHSSYSSTTSTRSTDNSRRFEQNNNYYGGDARSQARHNAYELRALAYLS